MLKNNKKFLLKDKELRDKMRSFIINLKIKKEFKQSNQCLPEEVVEQIFLARCKDLNILSSDD
jgi:hypothetical protein